MAPLLGTEADEETAVQEDGTLAHGKSAFHTIFHWALSPVRCVPQNFKLCLECTPQHVSIVNDLFGTSSIQVPPNSVTGYRPFPLYGLWTLAGTSTSLLSHGYISRRGRIGIGNNRGSRDLGLDYPHSKSMVLCSSTHPNYQAPNQSKPKSKTRGSRIIRRASEMIYIPTLSLV